MCTVHGGCRLLGNDYMFQGGCGELSRFVNIRYLGKSSKLFNIQVGQCSHFPAHSLRHEGGQHQAAAGSLHQERPLLDQVEVSANSNTCQYVFRNKTKFLHQSCRDSSRENLDLTGVLRYGLGINFDQRR